MTLQKLEYERWNDMDETSILVSWTHSYTFAQKTYKLPDKTTVLDEEFKKGWPSASLLAMFASSTEYVRSEETGGIFKIQIKPETLCFTTKKAIAISKIGRELLDI